MTQIPSENFRLETAFQIAESIPGGFFVYYADEEEEIIYVNSKMVQMFGCEDEADFRQFVGNSFRGIVCEDDYAEVEKSIQKQVEQNNRNEDQVTYRIRRKDGQIRWIKDYGSLVNSPQFGNVFYVFVSDITEELGEEIEQKRREEVVKGIGFNYNAVFLLELSTKELMPYSINGKVAQDVDAYLKQGNDLYAIAKYYAERYMELDDRADFLAAVDIDNIKNELQKTNYYSYTFHRKNSQGDTELVELSVRNPQRGKNAGNVILALRTIDEGMIVTEDERNQLLLKQLDAQKKKQAFKQRITDVLIDNYTDIYSVNRYSKQITIYRLMGQAKKMIEAVQETLVYEELCRAYINNEVYVEDRSLMFQAMDFEAICNAVKVKEEYRVHYRVYRNNEIHYFFMQISRDGDADSFENIVFAFGCEDIDMKQKELQKCLAAGNVKRSVLVVEDNRLARELLCEVLKNSYDVIIACDGLEAIEILKARYNEIAIVLLDLIMPHMDGMEVLEQIKDDPLLSYIPVIVLTDNCEPETEEKCLELGAVEFISKPYDAFRVLGRMKSIIRLKETAAMLSTIEYDEMTGLYTRQAFTHHISTLLATYPEKNYSIFVTDVDNFKLINSIYGEMIGDNVIKYLAEAFKKCENTELLARYAGDQLIGIWCTDKEHNTLDELNAFADRVCNCAPVSNLNLKIGVYESIDRKLSVAAICDRAISAVKSIKGKFEWKVASYDGPLSRQHEREQMMAATFDKAIENGEFDVWYQPKYDAVKETIIGAEALVRWKKEDGSFVSPGDFIPLFEENGLISRLDEYVFRRVCAFQKRLLNTLNRRIPISVNMSRTTLHHGDVAWHYLNIVNAAEIPMKLVPLELTESAAYRSIQIKELTENLRDAGFSLHMDDFGAGYSSLSSLYRLPFDVIKLDKTLIDFIGDDKGDRTLHHIIQLAQEFGMKVVAEGVETSEQLEFLKKLNCDAIQGFYFSKPVTQEEFLELLRKETME